MPYAEGRAYFDADSHLMEYAEWLADFADPAIQKELPAFVPHGSGGANALLDRIDENRKRVHDPECSRDPLGRFEASLDPAQIIPT
jgi:hypothetical protein